MGLGMPIPDLSNKPGPGRPGYGPTGAFEFKLEVEGIGDFQFNASKAAGGTSFSIDWGDGTIVDNQTASTYIHTYSSVGPHVIQINSENDSGPIDTFQVVGVQANKNRLKKILNWGTIPWSNLTSAFFNCLGLTNIEKSKFYGVNTVMQSAFQQCSSLVSADLSELNVSNNISIYQFFKDCTALQFLSIKNSNSKLNLGTLGTAQNQAEAFMNVGNSVSTGCEVIIKDTEFANVRTSQTSLADMFRNVRFKDTSDLSGLSFSGLAFNYLTMFQYAHVTQSNSFLNISNWSFNHTNEWNSLSLFFRFNDDSASGINTDIDTSNWYFGKTTGLVQWFYYCNIRTIRGLSTWTRDNSVVFTSLFRAFNRWFNAKIPSSDNFSSSFWANSRLSGNQGEMFQLAGSTSIDTETGSFPNLNGLALNAYSCGDAFRGSKWNTRVDFTGVSQYTGSGQVAATDCQRMFQSINVIGSDQKIVLNIDGLKILNARTLFYVSNVESIDVSSVVDFSSCVNFQFMFLGGTPYYDGNVTLPTNIDFSSATSWNGSLATNHFPEISFSTCQIDNLIRRVHATLLTPPSASVNMIYSPNSQVTEAPSVVQAQEAELVVKGWSITANTTDAALPFAYPAYMIDPDTGTTSNTPSLLPPVADRNFTSTNASITVNQTTGVLNWAAGVEGFTIVRCTYADGCYNEVSFGIQVPFVLETLVPTGGLNYRFNLQGSQYIDYGDGTSEFNTGSMDHTYAASGGGFGTWRTIKIFDQSATKKFTGISAWTSYNTNPARIIRSNILKWGDIVWEFFSFRRNINPIGIRNEAGDYPKFGSSLTSLEDSFNMFRDFAQINGGSGDTNTRFGDPNGSLNSWKISTASGSLGNITNFTQTFAINTMLGKSFVNDRNSQMNWNFNGATATAGSYGGRRYDRVFYVEGLASTTVTGSGILNSLRWYIIIDGTGTVSLDSNNFYAMPSVRNPGVNFQIGDTIKFSAGAFGSLSADITLTFGANDVLNSSQTPASLNWDTSNVTTFKGMFGANSAAFFTWARESVINMNNWDLSSTTSLELFGGGEFGNSAIISGSDFAPKAVSAADSSTGVAYTAWDTSNVTTFTNIKYLGDNIPGVLKYWRFNTSSNVNLFTFLNGRDLSSFVSLADEPCKTQIIASGDAGNPYGVDYTAWNMEKASNLSNFAYRTSSNTGISNFEILTPALSSWQISDSLTSFNNFAAKASGVSTFTPTVGSWDPSGITGTNIWNYTNNGDAWKFSTTTYDQLLDIASGWGQHASTVNTGVTLGMGDSQYTPGGNAEAGRTALINAGWIFNDNGAAVPPTVTVDFLVIAGGAGGGPDAGSGWGGGGGAGGYRNSYNNETSGGNSASETALSVTTSTNVTVTVGEGGNGATNNPGNAGEDSVFYTITSIGGGGGGSNGPAANGGSGGGSGTSGVGAPSRGLATANQGFDGGGNDGNWSGGGGGAGQVGGVNPPNGQGSAAMKGGNGLSSAITGTAVTRAGGGGGMQSGNPGPGGTGGGGNGGQPGTDGVTNTGSGGGAGGPGGADGGDGGSGIVILRYPSSSTITVGAGLTASTSTIGGDKVTIFTAGTGSISIA